MQIIDGSLDALWLILRIFLAGLCGFLIGYERKTRSKEAGIRTHAIVCMAACIMMIVSKYGFADQAIGSGGVRGADSARIAAQVVSGIGFLGAGVIIYRRDMLHGITTAAGIWATSGIGLALGAGMYVIGVASTLLLIGFQVLLHVPFKILRGRVYSTLKAQIEVNGAEDLQRFKDVFKIKRFLRYKENTDGKGGYIADLEFSVTSICTAERIHEIMAENPYIKSLEKYEEI
ncbi:MAG: MgtC/SapB family protein [Eubacteriales bacterium]|nr:MgtC/SapB family protein [Eubacteriales bacterium]